jgi:hypothetical protein
MLQLISSTASDVFDLSASDSLTAPPLPILLSMLSEKESKKHVTVEIE